jgi:hypothetical protein
VKTIILAPLIPLTPTAIVTMCLIQTAATQTLTATTMISALTTLASIMHASGLPPPALKIRIVTRAQAYVSLLPAKLLPLLLAPNNRLAALQTRSATTTILAPLTNAMQAHAPIPRRTTAANPKAIATMAIPATLTPV